MEAVIAQRYVKALTSLMDAEALANTKTLFDALAKAFGEKAFADIINDPNVADTAKQKLLLAIVAGANSNAVNNLVKLLVEKKRLAIIPAIAESLRLTLAGMHRTYEGKVYSNTAVEASTLAALSSDLGKKMDAMITLAFIASDYDGIKVEVEDLGVEVSLSKSRMNAQLVEHILKAI
ncbi:MAG: F0F1 ATP synthase subunit delta [Campylobacterales bacterium]|nr:F0F1 ATP synthase subunit delta [Campylobacterales bacterium]